MTRSASVSNLGTEFNDFLFAPIGESESGMPLSVLSALARLDIDPWLEAAELARLPGESAIQRLAALIRELPEEPSTHPDPKTIAARLIAFLPHGARCAIPTHPALLAVGAVSQSRVLFLYSMIFMLFMLVAQFFLADREPPADRAYSHVAASDGAKPSIPLSRNGK